MSGRAAALVYLVEREGDQTAKTKFTIRIAIPDRITAADTIRRIAIPRFLAANHTIHDPVYDPDRDPGRWIAIHTRKKFCSPMAMAQPWECVT